jgi:hypothetical protein
MNMNGPYELVCWIILGSSVITSIVAIAGMISPKFKDSFLQCCSLAAIAFGGFVITLQIYVHGVVQVSGVAFESMAFAVYSIATAMKYARVKNGTT